MKFVFCLLLISIKTVFAWTDSEKIKCVKSSLPKQLHIINYMQGSSRLIPNLVFDSENYFSYYSIFHNPRIGNFSLSMNTESVKESTNDEFTYEVADGDGSHYFGWAEYSFRDSDDPYQEKKMNCHPNVYDKTFGGSRSIVIKNQLNEVVTSVTYAN